MGWLLSLLFTFFIFGEFFRYFFIFEKMAKKFVKQKLFCLKIAKNPLAVSRCTFASPQTPPLLFWPKWSFGQKGTLASRSLTVFLRSRTEGLFDFWPKSGGWVWQLFGSNFKGRFLAKKGRAAGGMPFLGPFFWPLFGPFGQKGVIYQGTIVPFWPKRDFWGFLGKKGPKPRLWCPFQKPRFLGFLEKIASRGFWHFLSFFGNFCPFLAKNPVSPRLRFFRT